MHLDKLIIETRLRSGWAAIDLGFTLARRYWLRAVAVYLIPALCVFGLTRLVDDYHYLLPYFMFWWFKPVFERPILYLISRELFSEKMSLTQILREYKSWLTPSLLAIVTTRRLSFYRGMTAPIGLLEGPKGAAFRARATVLGSKYGSEALWLNLVLFHLESFFAVGILIMIELLAPNAIEFTSLSIVGASQSLWLGDLVTVLIMAGVAPFFVIAGFMLYISRRIELEGWDIEIAFRDWMLQLQRKKNATRSPTRIEPPELGSEQLL